MDILKTNIIASIFAQQSSIIFPADREHNPILADFLLAVQGVASFYR